MHFSLNGACGVTVYTSPHNELKICLATVGIEPTTLELLAQWIKQLHARR